MNVHVVCASMYEWCVTMYVTMSVCMCVVSVCEHALYILVYVMQECMECSYVECECVNV